MSKKYIGSVIVVITIAGVIIWKSNTKPETARQPLKIGISAPLTGPVAGIGEFAVQGMKLAADQINAQGGINDLPLRLVIEDDKCSPKEGAAAITKLLDQDHVAALAVYCGGVTAVAANIVNGRALTYSVTVRATDLEGRHPFLFNMQPSAKKEVQVLVDHMQTQGLKRVAILHQADFYGQTYSDSFRQAWTKAGGTVLGETSLDNAATPDFRSDLAKAKEQGADAIFTSFNAPQYAAILKQSQEVGLHVRFFSVWNTESPVLLENAGALANGIVYTHSFKMARTDAYHRFARHYQERYGTTPDSNAANGYDIIQLITEAMRQCGHDQACLVSATQNLKNYPGLSGEINFKDNSADKPIYLKTIKDQNFVFLEY